MAQSFCRRLSGVVLAALVWVWAATPAGACPFCVERGPTMIGDYQRASMVLFGKFTKPRFAANGEGISDFAIEAALKKDAILGDKKSLTLPCYVSETRSKFLLFCNVYKGGVDPYRGVAVRGDGDIVKYLRGLIALKDRPPSARLRYCFDFLDNPELEVSLDAYREFAAADYKDYRDMARGLPADTLAKWLQDPKTPAYRIGLYASLLGHCGKDEHARVLRRLLEEPQKRSSLGIDGMLAAYTMLKPKEGWAYLCHVLKDAEEDFPVRYGCLRTIRFLWDTRPDLVDKKELVEGMCLLLNQFDVADYTLEDLRRWSRWEVLDRVLALADKKSHEVRSVQRSILRFALSCQHLPKAAEFVKKVRKQDPEFVKDTEELLKFEAEAPALGPTKAAPAK
jgi:hypothetical protein